jgi:hypothetical protein
MRKEFPVSLVLSSVFSYLLVYFEYYSVTLNGVPYREISVSGFMETPPYFLFPLLPALTLVALLPIIADLVLNRYDLSQVNRRLSLSLANFLWAITLYDALFYALRAFSPLPTDPLAGLWITAGEDSFAGLVNLFGTLLPTWYFATIPIVVSIYLAYYIS